MKNKKMEKKQNVVNIARELGIRNLIMQNANFGKRAARAPFHIHLSFLSSAYQQRFAKGITRS